MKKCLIVIAAFVVFACMISLFGCNNNEQSQLPSTEIETDEDSSLEKFIVKYIIDGELYKTETVTIGSRISQPETELRQGYVFKGWYLTTDFLDNWNFENDTVEENLTLYGSWVNTEVYYKVLYKDGNDILYSITVLSGYSVNALQPVDKFGYTFLGWYCDDEPFDFSAPIDCDFTLYAKWEPIKYSITFIANGEIIDTCYYTIENKNINIPGVPAKEYYDGSWNWNKELNYENIEVQATYTPIVYQADFYVNGELIETLNYTVDDEIELPQIPTKVGYESQWSQTLTGGNITINAIYNPITYTATYVSNGEVIAKKYFTIESHSLEAPSVPVRAGYSGKWDDAVIQASDITINAVYSLITYTAEFIVDNETIATVSYSVENMDISVPEIPQKDGYTAEWSEYNLDSLTDIKVYAIYTPIKPSNSETSSTSESSTTPETSSDPSTSETPTTPKTPSDPSSPEIEPTEEIYYVSFIAENEVIAEVSFTAVNEQINEPAVPQKDGYIGIWQDYELTLDNISVYAQYCEDKFIYGLLADGTYSITGYTGSETNLIIPSAHNGLPVTEIADKAFMQNDNIFSAIICDGIEVIGDYAFAGCVNLESVKLSNTLTSIGYGAFLYNGFNEIVLPDSLKYIDKYAFSETKLKSIAIPIGITVIDENTFTECLYLESVSLPTTLTTIKKQAFAGCINLAKINLENVSDVEDEAFKGTPIDY